MKNIVFISVLLLLGVVCFSSCKDDSNKYNAHYDINHYIDTISSSVVLTTVCSYQNNVSVSTIILEDFN